MSVELENMLHCRSAAGASWSSINLAEAMPGVLSPLGWSVWGPPGERGAQQEMAKRAAVQS